MMTDFDPNDDGSAAPAAATPPEAPAPTAPEVPSPEDAEAVATEAARKLRYAWGSEGDANLRAANAYARSVLSEAEYGELVHQRGNNAASIAALYDESVGADALKIEGIDVGALTPPEAEAMITRFRDLHSRELLDSSQPLHGLRHKMLAAIYRRAGAQEVPR